MRQQKYVLKYCPLLQSKTWTELFWRSFSHDLYVIPSCEPSGNEREIQNTADREKGCCQLRLNTWVFIAWCFDKQTLEYIRIIWFWDLCKVLLLAVCASSYSGNQGWRRTRCAPYCISFLAEQQAFNPLPPTTPFLPLCQISCCKLVLCLPLCTLWPLQNICGILNPELCAWHSV